MTRIQRYFAVLILGCLLAGCTSTDQSSSPKNYDDASREYKDAIASLTLPPSAGAWPDLSKEQEGHVLTYEPGAAAGMAQSHWLCAWEQEWINQRGRDASHENAALSQLEKFPQMRHFADYDDIGRNLYRDYLTKAKLGDPSGFQQDVRANCV